MKEERNALQKYVFPKLRKLCIEHGFRFQAIDLRWGVSEEAGLDQQTMKICLEEIERSQKVSPKPNFIVLLGDRYGWKPLPYEIPADEFEEIEKHVSVNNLQLLNKWYLRDDNAVPPVYDLQPRIDNFIDYDVWSNVEEELRTILSKAAIKSNFSEEQMFKYTSSATEQEILKGALNLPEDLPNAKEHVFGFFREIDNLEDVKDAAVYLPNQIPREEFVEIKNNLDNEFEKVFKDFYTLINEVYVLNLEKGSISDKEYNKIKFDFLNAFQEAVRNSNFHQDIKNNEKIKEKYLANDFIDLIKILDDNKNTYRNVFDDLSHNKLQDLKLRIKNELSDNVKTYSAHWDQGLNNDHIGILPDDVIERSESNIEIGDHNTLCVAVWNRLYPIIKQEIEKIEEIDPLIQEIHTHKSFGEDRCRFFQGRVDILDKIQDYLRGKSNSPLVIYGESGSGKSALIAEAIKNFDNNYYHNNQNLFEKSVVSRFIGATPESSDIKQLLIELYEQISKIYGNDNPETPTEFKDVVKSFIDSLTFSNPDKPLILFIDALDQMNDRYSAHNLNWLPRILPENVKIVVSTLPGNIYNSLKNKIGNENILELKPMDNIEGSKLLDLWFGESKISRKLTQNQENEVLSKFNNNGLPLYLKLAFEEAKRWKSYSSNIELQPDISGLIRQMFERLSAPENHGKTVVSHVFGYLSASKNGLTEDEILDILSKDKEVFAQTLKYHNPPEEKLPVALWSRLYFDLEPYITEKAADETSLLTFYHRQISEIASEEFLHDDVKTKRHKLLADYFNEQELQFKKDDVVINIRKVSELPYQQTKAKLVDDLSKTLSDLLFIEAKCMAGLVTDLVLDYNRLGIGIQFGPPIITANNYKDKNGVFCPFCKAWFLIEEPELGKIIKCQFCENELKINSFYINKEWKPSKPKKLIEKQFADEKIELGKHEDTLNEFAQFIYRQNHTLSLFPYILLQQALNEPDNSLIAIQARNILNSRPGFKWIEHINKPQVKDSYIFNIFDEDYWFASFDYFPDGRTMIVNSANGQSRILDIESGEELNEFKTEINFKRNYVPLCRCSPEGTKVFIHTEDAFINIFDLDLNEMVFSLPVNYRKHLDFLKNNTYFPFFSLIILWGYNNFSRFGLRYRLRSIFRFPKKYYGIQFINEKTIVAFNQSNDFEVWDIQNKKKISSFKQLKGYNLRLSPDNNLIATSKGNVIYLTRLNDLKSTSYGGDCFDIIDFKFSPDCKEMLVIFADKTLNVYNIENFDVPEFIKDFQDFEQDWSCCDYSPDGKKIVAGFRPENQNAEMIIWDTDTGNAIITNDSNPWGIYDCKFSPDGNYVANCASDKSLKIWNLRNLNQDKTLFNGNIFSEIKHVHDLKFLPGGKEILISDDEFKLSILNIETGKKEDIKNKIMNTPNFSPDGDLIFLGRISFLSRSTKKIWKIKTYANASSFSFSNELKFNFSPDGSFIAHHYKIFDVFSYPKIILKSLIDEKVLKRINIPITAKFSTFAISPDMKILMVSWDNELAAFDISNIYNSNSKSDEIKQLFNENFSSYIDKIIFSSSGRYFILGLNHGKSIIVWDLVKKSIIIDILVNINQFKKSLDLNTDKSYKYQIYVTPNEEYIIVSSGNLLKILNSKTGKLLKTFLTEGEIVSFDIFGQDIILADALNNFYYLKMSGFSNELAYVTPVRKFLFEKKKWEKNINYTCPWCGSTNVLENKLIDYINKIHDTSRNEKFIFDIPDEYWFKKNLLKECSFCGKMLRINPYLIDNK